MSAQSANSSQPKQRFADRVVLGVLLGLLIALLCWLGRSALEARERIAAPTSFLAICFAVSFGGMLGGLMILRWRVGIGQPAHIYQMFLTCFTMSTLTLFPKVAADWFGMFHKLSRPALKDVEAQAQVTMLVGLLMVYMLALCLRRASARALDKSPASPNDDPECQKSSSP